MGILDEAIREHLELKRQHGAEESEIEGLEAEAFGPADRPDATTEAETQVISSEPGAAAGEGDQLDKVFEAGAKAEPVAQEQTPSAETGSPEPSEEVPSAGSAAATDAEDDAATEAESGKPPEASTGSAEAASASEESAAVAPTAAEGTDADEPSAAGVEASDEGDAGDMLEAERHHLASHPTEHYDVDAAIAEEDEIDLLSESSLSDELDRALDGPAEPEASTPEPVETGIEPGPESERAAASPAPPAPAEPAAPSEESDEAGADEDDDFAPEDSSDEDGADDDGSDDEPESAEEPEAGGDFFDQEDPLEGTPDFLEETPEHDRLWFEQKEPKDFDFGD